MAFLRKSAAGGDKPGAVAPDAELQRLRRAVDELQILNDLALSIGRARGPDEIIRKIVNRARHAVGAEEADIKLVDPAERQGTGAGMQTVHREQSSAVRNDDFRLDKRMLLGLMLAQRQPLLSNDPTHDPRVRALCAEGGVVRSILLVPLVVKSETTGVLIACNKQDASGFTENDMRLLAIMAGNSAQVLENSRLLEQERQLVAVREQLRLSRDIQLGLLPQASPPIPGYDVAGVSIPAQEVGGDYFDFISTAAGRWAVCLGDVSGKGLPASLLMANLQATLRGQARFNERPEDCVTWSNRLLYQCTDPEKFATLFYGVLDPATHEMQFCNAGHERPLLLRVGGGEPELLVTGGIVLGILDDFAYRGGSVRFEPGDLLVMFSDGVTDAENEFETEFGSARLLETARALRGAPATAVVEGIVAAVRAHAAGAAQADDITLVAVRRTA